MPRGLPAERARAWVQAVLQQLEAVWDECTCAGAALLATFSLSSLRVLALAPVSHARRDGAPCVVGNDAGAKARRPYLDKVEEGITRCAG